MKLLLVPDEESHGLGTQRESRYKKSVVLFPKSLG